MAGWGDARPGNGCSAGRTWDPWLKSAWIVHGIGGTANQLGMVDYHSRSPAARFCAYDLATDRFRPVAFREAPYGERATRLACDWKTGLVMPVKLTHPVFKTKDFPTLDVRAGLVWRERTKPAGPYPRHDGASYTMAAVDQGSGLLVLYVPPIGGRPPRTWTYDPAKDEWKDREPKVQPHAVPGGGLVYDPYHKLLVLQGGKKESQFGGPADSLTWTYDVRTNIWTDRKAKGGPGSPWVGAMDFDPEHNVFVLFNFRDKRVWAYRLGPLKPGAKAG